MLHARDQFVDQQRDVLDPLAQRRQLDGELVEAVVEIVAQPPLGHPLLEVVAGGGDHPHVDRPRQVAARALEAALLQHAQQAHLQLGRQVGDLVDVQGAAGGQFQATLAAGDGAGQRAGLAAEQLAFQQLRIDGRAADRHEGKLATAGMVVQVARHHFLAAAGLAEQQHADLGAGDLLHLLAYLLDRPAGADQAAEQVGLALLTALAGGVEGLLVDLGAVQGVEQLVVARRHVETRQHAAAQLLRPVGAALLAEQQQRQVIHPGAELLEQARGAALAVDLTEQHAGQTHIRLRFELDGPVAAGASAAGLAEEVEDHRQIMAALGKVVDQQDSGFTPHDCSAGEAERGHGDENEAPRRCWHRKIARSNANRLTPVNFMWRFPITPRLRAAS